MESTLKKTSLSETWLKFREENPGTIIRNGARELNTTEAEIVASFVGNSVTKLNKDFLGLLKRMPEIGYIKSVTRNDDCVHEKFGWFQDVHLNEKGGAVSGSDIDLRIFFPHWAYAFALEKEEKAGFERSIQVFDEHGVSITKIFVLERSDREKFNKIVEDFKAEEQSDTIEIVRGKTRPEAEDDKLDKEAFLAAWRALKDTHDYFSIMKKYKVSRLHAVHVGEGEFTKKVSTASAQNLLYYAAGSGLPIMVFAGNNGEVQIHTGTIGEIREIPDWINVIDREFHLHLRTAPIAECWVVNKPNKESDVHALECYDKEGNMIVQFYGKRHPGIPEDPAWTKYVTSLQ